MPEHQSPVCFGSLVDIFAMDDRSASPYAVPLRTGAFCFQTPTLFWRRLHLYANRLELRGWHWIRRYRRGLPLHRILQTDVVDATLVLWLADGTTIRLCVDDAQAWKQAIDARLPASS